MTDREQNSTPRFVRAVELAARVHATQVRKGSSIPYISHPLAVATMVMEHGGSEDEVIAALLHDAAEDHGAGLLSEITREFGRPVAEIVRGCSDSLEEVRPPWRERKLGYIGHLRDAPSSVQLVAAADKLHNSRAILSDYRSLGARLWSRFSGGRDGVLWYYQQLASVLRTSAAPAELSAELLRTVNALVELVERRERLSSPALPVPDGMELSASFWAELRARYGEPPRAYHNFRHIRDVLSQFTNVAIRAGWARPREVWLASACHDAIYDVTSSDNEAESAAFARSLISRHEVGGVDVDYVCSLIELTARHGRIPPESVSEEEALFLDCDMAILGAAPSRFAEFEAAVRAEYAPSIGDDAYAAGRLQFLERLHDAPRIFLSPLFHQSLDARARQNIAAALGELGAVTSGRD